MAQAFESLIFILAWIVWIVLSPVVLIAGLAQQLAFACNHDWKPWAEVKPNGL